MSMRELSDENMAPDLEYDELLASIRARFAASFAAAKPVEPDARPPALFTTDVAGLDERFLDALPEACRQEYRCATCRSFFQRYGGLVTIDEVGRASAALWSSSPAPGRFAAAEAKLAEAVKQAAVTGVFMSSEPVWGTSPKGGWDHLSITPPPALVYPSDRPRSAEQMAADKREDFRLLSAGLLEFPRALVKQAEALLSTGGLYRSESCIGVAKWLLGVHQAVDQAKSARARERVIWRAVASAPAGFCHVRSSMIGTLLIDLVEGLPFASIKARFDAKMHPLQYQRPTAAPGQQNIERAEKIVAMLRSEGALERRFATLDDLETLWRPAGKREREREGGVFAGVLARNKAKATATKLDAPPVVMTWTKFAKTVIPRAASIEYWAAAGSQPLAALVTAKDLEATPIVAWDSPERRNPVTWYTYVKGSAPAAWNLKANTHVRVTAITLAPSMWGSESERARHAHHGNKVFFVLEGAKDLEHKAGGGFFPSHLKNDYREVRATLEAYATQAVIAGKHEASACGLMLAAQGSGSWAQRFRVSDDEGVAITYELDRWD